MKLYQPTYRDKQTGELKAVAVWWLEHHIGGRRIRMSLKTRSKRAAELKAGEIIRDAELRGAGINTHRATRKANPADLARLQEELGNRTVEGTAGGGMVTARATGKQEILSIEIEKEVVDPEDLEMLQDLVTAAVNEALRKARELAAEEMGKLTGGVGIPGLL